MAWNRPLAFPLAAIVLTLGTATRLAAQQLPFNLGKRQPRHGGRVEGRRADAPARDAQGHLASGERRRGGDPGLCLRRGGKPLQIPGPAIRVPQGTTIDITLRNELTVPATLHGLHQRPGTDDDVVAVDGRRDPARPLRGRRAGHVSLLWPHAGRAPRQQPPPRRAAGRRAGGGSPGSDAQGPHLRARTLGRPDTHGHQREVVAVHANGWTTPWASGSAGRSSTPRT